MQRIPIKHFPLSRQLIGDIKARYRLSFEFAERNSNTPKTIVIVVCRPNDGTSTLLNVLWSARARCRPQSAADVCAAKTCAVIVKLYFLMDLLVYPFDSPGVTPPFLGRGEKGAQRDVKLAPIVGIKEGLYDIEAFSIQAWCLELPSKPSFPHLQDDSRRAVNSQNLLPISYRSGRSLLIFLGLSPSHGQSSIGWHMHPAGVS